LAKITFPDEVLLPGEHLYVYIATPDQDQWQEVFHYQRPVDDPLLKVCEIELKRTGSAPTMNKEEMHDERA